MLRVANEAFERLSHGEKLIHARFVLNRIRHECGERGCGHDPCSDPGREQQRRDDPVLTRRV